MAENCIEKVNLAGNESKHGRCYCSITASLCNQILLHDDKLKQKKRKVSIATFKDSRFVQMWQSEGNRLRNVISE